MKRRGEEGEGKGHVFRIERGTGRKGICGLKAKRGRLDKILRLLNGGFIACLQGMYLGAQVLLPQSLMLEAPGLGTDFAFPNLLNTCVLRV